MLKIRFHPHWYVPTLLFLLPAIPFYGMFREGFWYLLYLIYYGFGLLLIILFILTIRDLIRFGLRVQTETKMGWDVGEINIPVNKIPFYNFLVFYPERKKLKKVKKEYNRYWNILQKNPTNEEFVSRLMKKVQETEKKMRDLEDKLFN